MHLSQDVSHFFIVILSCYNKQVCYEVLIQTNTESLTVVTLTKENNTQLVSAAENQSIHTCYYNHDNVFITIVVQYTN